MSGVVDLLPPPEGHSHDEEGDDHDEADHDEEEGHDEDGHEEEGHDHGDVDPHFWQDPQRMAAVVTALEDKLGAVVPDAASSLTANADAVVAELTKLDGEFTSGLASCERAEFITAHCTGLMIPDLAGLTVPDWTELQERIDDFLNKPADFFRNATSK